MKHTVVKEHSTAKVTVVYEKEEWLNAQEKAYAKLGQNVTIDGFRKGKAPLNAVKKAVPVEKMLDEAIDYSINKCYSAIMEQEKFDVVAQATVEEVKPTKDQLEFTFLFPLKPEFEVGQYKDLGIKLDEIEVKEEEIADRLAKIQEANAVVSVKEDGAKIEEGDIVKFDFEGFLDGKAFEGGKAEDYELTIGSHAFIPGFEEGMIGLEKGYKGDLPVKFPEQYTKELAGKDAIFKINIKEISKKTLPEIDDDLAIDAEIEGVNNLEELKAHVVEDIKASKRAQVQDKALNEIIDKIVENTTIELPARLVFEEQTAQMNQFKKDCEQRGLPFEKYLEVAKKTEQEIFDGFHNNCEKNLKAMLILNKIAVTEKIDVTDADIDAEFQLVADQYGMEFEKVKELLKDRINEVANQVYSRKLSKFLLEVNGIEVVE